MSWVRIHDDAMTHPKLTDLPDKAFRLWVWGLSYCQRHLTDGAIPRSTLPARLKAAADRLIEARLWEPSEKGFHVHDYCDWNDSKDTVTKKRMEARERIGNARARSSQNVRERTTTPVLQRTPFNGVLRGVGSTSSLCLEEEEKQALTMRAGALLQRYEALFYEHRRGARYHKREHLDFPKAVELVRTWPDDARLEKLAVIILTTDDDWISKTDRGFGIFALKASWADDKLAAWEAAQKATV